jgi:hypothetical protein
MFIIYLHTKSHMTKYNDSIAIAIKRKAEYRFHAAAILLFYMLQMDSRLPQQRLHIFLRLVRPTIHNFKALD